MVVKACYEAVLFCNALGGNLHRSLRYLAGSGMLWPRMATTGVVPRGGELAARVRAAIAYSGKTHEELLEQLGFSQRTLSRYIATGGRDDANGRERRLEIAQACMVPAWFMLDGWAGGVSDSQREELEGQVGELRLQLAELERVVRTEREGSRRKRA